MKVDKIAKDFEKRCDGLIDLLDNMKENFLLKDDRIEELEMEVEALEETVKRLEEELELARVVKHDTNSDKYRLLLEDLIFDIDNLVRTVNDDLEKEE